MATLNLQNTTDINLITTAVSLANTSLTSLLSNAASSTYINKVVSITVSNNSASAANITLAYYSAAALGGTAYPIASTVSVPAYGSLMLLDAGTFIYLKDDSSLGVTAGTGGVLTVTCAYAKITAVAEFVPTPPGPSAGGLWMWGRNYIGELGQNNLIYRSSPVQVGALTTWFNTQSSSGSTFAIKGDGTLWSWGNNSVGYLGQNNRINRSSPVQVGALTTWSKVAAMLQATIFLKTDGTLWTCGYGSSGEQGQGAPVNRSSPTQLGALTNWSKITCNAAAVFAVKTDGTLWTWGQGYQGQLGQNSTANISSPTQVGALTNWSNPSNGYHVGAVVKTDGTLWTWGRNQAGQLGQNDRVSRSSPVQVGSDTNWSQCFMAQNVLLAVKTNGTLWSWGGNGYGQAGQNDKVNRSSPVQVGALTTWSKIGGSSSGLSLGLKTDGTLWAWGSGRYGMLGNGLSPSYRSSPVQVDAGITWQSVGYTRGFFASAIKT